jgi:hypothetical protein
VKTEKSGHCASVATSRIAPSDRPAPPRLSAHNLADHRRLGAPLSRDDQNLARSDPINGKENGPEVGRLAQRRDRASKQTGLPSDR